MATTANRFFNNPQFAMVASNLANMFAPPSGSDEFGYARAASEREQAGRLRDLWVQAGEDFDRRGMASGQWAPNQSLYSVDQGNATTRRGQDVAAATSRANNLQTSQYGLMGDLATTVVKPGERALGTTVLDDDIATAVGLQPGMAVEGRQAPLSTDEWQSILQQRDVQENPLMAQDYARDGMSTVKTIGPDGQPQYVPEGRAATLGLPAYQDQGGRAGQELIQWYDAGTDTRGTAVFDPNVGGMRPMDGSPPMPPTAIVVKPGEPTGTSAELGVGKPASNVIDRGILSIDQTVRTLDTLSGLIGENPASQGMVGSIRGTFQNLAQTGNELAQYFGGEVARINDDVQRGAIPPELAGAFDPSLPAIEVMSNVLAFQYAKTLNEDRLSNEMLLQARRALGLDRMTANQADSLARLGQVRETLLAERDGLLAKKTGGLNAGAPPATAPGPSVGQVDLTPEERHFLGID